MVFHIAVATIIVLLPLLGRSRDIDIEVNESKTSACMVDIKHTAELLTNELSDRTCIGRTPTHREASHCSLAERTMTDRGHFVASVYPNNGRLNVEEAIPVTLARHGVAALEGVCSMAALCCGGSFRGTGRLYFVDFLC